MMLTALSSMVVDALNKTRASSKVGIAFLYCLYAERKDQTINQLLGSLIQQLLLQHGAIPEEVRTQYDSHMLEKTQPDLAELSKRLGSTTSLFSKVYIVIDALDECDDTNKTRSLLLEQLQNLNTSVQLFLTSRPLEELRLDSVRFNVTAQEDDMRRYLRAQLRQESRLAKLCADNRGLEVEILDKIIAKADGMSVYKTPYLMHSRPNTSSRFLLAKLHLQAIATGLRLRTIRDALETLPENLNDTYDETMRRIKNGQHETRSDLAVKTLMLLSYALRPLNLGEVQHALLTREVKPHETSIDRDDVYDKELLLTICAGIIIVEDGTSSIRFVHHTAATYFEDRRQVLFPNAQIEFTSLCVTYLSFDEFKRGPCQTDAEFEERLRSNQLYDYAAHNWGIHARDAPEYQGVIDFLEDMKKVEASSQALMAVKSSWDSTYSQDFPKQMTGLHLAAYFGVQTAMNKLLQHWQHVDLKDSYGRTPLSRAAENGHAAVVELLLATGKVDIDSKDISGQTPLSSAAENGHAAVVELLLSTGKVDVDSKS